MPKNRLEQCGECAKSAQPVLIVGQLISCSVSNEIGSSTPAAGEGYCQLSRRRLPLIAKGDAIPPVHLKAEARLSAVVAIPPEDLGRASPKLAAGAHPRNR